LPSSADEPSIVGTFLRSAADIWSTARDDAPSGLSRAIANREVSGSCDSADDASTTCFCSATLFALESCGALEGFGANLETDCEALGFAVHNDRPQRRYPGLLARLRGQEQPLSG